MVCKLLFPRRTRREPLCLKFVTSLSLSPWRHLSRARPRRAARGGGQPEPLPGGGGEPRGLLRYMRWSIGAMVYRRLCPRTGMRARRTGSTRLYFISKSFCVSGFSFIRVTNPPPTRGACEATSPRRRRVLREKMTGGLRANCFRRLKHFGGRIGCSGFPAQDVELLEAAGRLSSPVGAAARVSRVVSVVWPGAEPGGAAGGEGRGGVGLRIRCRVCTSSSAGSASKKMTHRVGHGDRV